MLKLPVNHCKFQFEQLSFFVENTNNCKTRRRGCVIQDLFRVLEERSESLLCYLTQFKVNYSISKREKTD